MAKNDLINGSIWDEYSQIVQDRMNNPKFMGEITEEEAKEKGEICSEQAAEELLFTYFSSMFGISVNWSHSKKDYDVLAAMKRAFEVVFR